MIKKLPKVMEHIIDSDPDIVFFAETWLQTEKNSVTAEVKTFGYKLLHDPRKDREKEQGGGVGIMVRDSMSAKHLPAKHFKSFEHTVISLPLANGKKIILISFYRLLFAPINLFLEEFSDLLDQHALSTESLILAGDVNLHMETDCPYATELVELLSLHNLKQHIKGPTHVKGHTLDIIISENKDDYLEVKNIKETDVSDHFLVDFYLKEDRGTCKTKLLNYRPTKKLDIEHFSREVTLRLGSLPLSNDVQNKVANYNETLKQLVDEMAPIKSKKVKIAPNSPWFDEEYSNIRKLRRKAEKKFRKTGLVADKKCYIALRKEAINLSHLKKKSHISKRLEANSGRSLYVVLNELTDKTKETILPTAKSDKALADDFLIYFKAPVLWQKGESQNIPLSRLQNIFT